MLQWMGGSRRKVASTRKSIQSRQKQYFEQKRLQQQAIGGGKVFEENILHGRHSENNRSLDVLSMQGLSKVPQDHMPTCGLATASNEVEHESQNGQTVQHSQLFGRFQQNENKPPIGSKTDEAGSLSNHQSWNANTQRTSDITPADRMKTFNSDHLNLPPEQGELCIIDMLGDEDPNFSSTKNSKPEDHAAFSIEGLGDVDMDPTSRTSVLSPKAHCRTFLHGCSSPSEAMRPAYSFDLDTRQVDLAFEMETLMPEAAGSLRKSSMEHSFDPDDRPDLFCKSKQGFFNSEDHSPFNDNKNSFESSLTMMPEVDVTLCKSSMEHSFGQRDRPEIHCKSKQRLFDSEDNSPFDGNKNSFNDPLQDEESLFNSRQSIRRIWHAKPSTQLDQIFDESDLPFPHGDWMDQMDASTDYVSGMNLRKKEFTFQEAYQPKSRISMRRSGKYEPPDSPEPFMMPQRPRDSHNFTFPDMSWYPPTRSCHDVRDFVDERRRYEDSRDNTSLPSSEESCSSSAVKGMSRKGSLNSKKKQSFKNVDVTCSDDCGMYNMPSWERSSDKWKTAQARENVTGQGKFTRTSNPQRSRPDFESNLAPEKRLRPDDGRLFETAFDLSKATSGRNSYFQKSEPREPLSCHTKLWFEDTFDASEDPKPYGSGLCAEKYSSLPAVCSPPSSLELEEGDFHLPNLENSMLRPSMANLSEDCNFGNRNSKSSCEQSFLASEQQSTTEVAAEKADVPTSEHGKSEPEGDTSSCEKSSSSKIESSRDTAGDNDGGPAKVDYDKDTSFLPHGEEVSPVAETSGINDHVDEIIKLDAQTSLSCPTGVKEKLMAEEFHPLERKMEGKGQSSTDYSSGQVMMLNSFVMQFLCIQVMNEASAKGNRAHQQLLDEFPVDKAVIHR